MKYKNITEQDLSVIGVGIVKVGQEVEMPKGFNNANFKIVKKEKEVETKKLEINKE